MTQHIDKDALVAEIEKIMYAANLEADIAVSEEFFDEKVANAKYNLCKHILNILDTLEVKEVDLEKEANECWNYVFSALGWDENSLMTMNHKEFLAFAKHFYELGLKAKVMEE